MNKREKANGKKKRKKSMLTTIIIVLVMMVLLWTFTPFGYFHVRPEGEYQMNLTINGQKYTATMENNSSACALKHLLNWGPKTIHMRDYGGMEKVGMLWKGLPSNNTELTTEPGDLVLFMGSSFVVYYNTNHWNFTKLGHINNVTQDELKQILGDGDVTIELSLP